MSKRRDEVFSQDDDLDGSENIIKDMANGGHGQTDSGISLDQESLLAAREHLTKHQKYPAGKQDILMSLEDMPGINEADKDWMESKLPDKTFHSAKEVLKELN